MVYNIEEVTPSAAIRVGSMTLVINPSAASGLSAWVAPSEGKLDKEFSGNGSFVGVGDGLCNEENTNFA